MPVSSYGALPTVKFFRIFETLSLMIFSFEINYNILDQSQHRILDCFCAAGIVYGAGGHGVIKLPPAIFLVVANFACQMDRFGRIIAIDSHSMFDCLA